MLAAQTDVDRAVIPAAKRLELKAALTVVADRVKKVAKDREELQKTVAAKLVRDTVDALKAAPDQRVVVPFPLSFLFFFLFFFLFLFLVFLFFSFLFLSSPLRSLSLS